MIEAGRIMVTGGSGLLGKELAKLWPEAAFPSSGEFDVTNYAQMKAWLEGRRYELLLHAAAFTSPPKVDKEPVRAAEVNILGTVNVVKLCMAQGLRLVYVSTDYVFRGDQGNYGEEDPLYAVNKYAWSKLGGECEVRMYDNALIVRTTFGPNVFPYEKAFVDQWTSRECVSAIAAKLAEVATADLRGVIHLGGRRRTVYEYACSLDQSKAIAPLSIKDVSFRVPADTSLNCERYRRLSQS